MPSKHLEAMVPKGLKFHDPRRSASSRAEKVWTSCPKPFYSNKGLSNAPDQKHFSTEHIPDTWKPSAAFYFPSAFFFLNASHRAKASYYINKGACDFKPCKTSQAHPRSIKQGPNLCTVTVTYFKTLRLCKEDLHHFGQLSPCATLFISIRLTRVHKALSPRAVFDVFAVLDSHSGVTQLASYCHPQL